MQYVTQLYKTRDLSSQRDYFSLSEKYSGVGFSDTSFDDELLGSFFVLFIESDKLLNLDDLQNEFPSVSVVGLESGFME